LQILIQITEETGENQLKAKIQHSPLLQIKSTNLKDFDVVGTWVLAALLNCVVAIYDH
jgi:hypothetical protein